MFQIWKNITIKKGNWLVWCNHMIMDSCSRTSLEEIVNVSHVLKLFTLAELFFVLHENSNLSLFDVNRIKKITDGVRYKFGGEHTYEQVETVIELLGDSYPQTLPMQAETSLLFISYGQLLKPVISPFSCVCSMCKCSLNKFNAKQRSIRIYCVNGSVVSGEI